MADKRVPTGDSQGKGAQADSSAGSKFGVTAPAITLPKGGGAVRGMGEKFAANPVTGTGSVSVPIATSPGRSGFGPQLSLSYDSGAGNGPFGFGWSLSLPAITRKTDKGLPQYLDAEESDVFILSGSEDLAPVLVEDEASRLPIEDQRHWKRAPFPRTLDNPENPSEKITYQVQRYRPRIEGLFARIERWTDVGSGEIHWRSISKDNVTTLYGKDNNSRIYDPDDAAPGQPARIFSWLISESFDDKGNAITYTYKPEDGDGVDLAQAHERNRGDRASARRQVNRYLKSIQYGNRQSLLDADGHRPISLTSDWVNRAGWMFEVVFDYGEHDIDDPTPQDAGEWPCRNDPFSSYRAGFEVRTYRLCQRALMFHHFANEPEVGADCLVRSTDFTYSYEENPCDVRNPIYSALLSVVQSGYKRQNAGYLKRSLPPLEFEYSQVPLPNELAQQPIYEVDPAALENLPYGVDGSAYQWVDLNGEGISGILTEQGDAWYYKRNLSPDGSYYKATLGSDPGLPQDGNGQAVAWFGPLEPVATRPAARLGAGQAQFLDLAGDGQIDLVQVQGPVRGFYERTDDAGWEPFRPFSSWPNVDTRDPNLRFVDLTGDGHADIVITEDDVITWYPSLAESGFGPAERVCQALDEEKGPRLVFADGTQSVYLSDLSGDGLSDLVRIRNGEVCYWPNLGYGRFGPKVTMDNSPWLDSPDQFDQRRIRLADTDGSGTTDILYLRRDGVQIYFNQSGNRWSDPVPLPQFPPVDNLADVQVADLLGTGTACLVWSSPLPGAASRPMRYIDLMDRPKPEVRQKPHLLVVTKNNLGAETRVQYAPSTRFYLQDEREGKPWITRLPFPVHVVERVETYDRISRNRFVTRYAYHHGYFDGEEREFRGFGMVEQKDTEEIGQIQSRDVDSTDTNIDEASFVPPVLTKTWFHTGAFIQGAKISRHFEDEYYRESGISEGVPGPSDEQLEAMLLPDTVLPDSIRTADGARVDFALSADQTREACRALKGSILRQEVYALDGTDEQDRPYTVSERNYTVELVQPEGPNQHTVFFASPRETIDFHYERKLYEVQAGTATIKVADPRVTHSINLEIDAYGNILKSVAIGYGRRIKDPDLVEDDQDKQSQTLITYTESQFTNAIGDLLSLPPEDREYPDDYRTPLPSQTGIYELINVTQRAQVPPEPPLPQGITDLFGFEELESLVNGPKFESDDWQIGYEDIFHQQATGDHPYRRLIENVRTLYRKDDLTALLPLGVVEPLALPGESYKLAFTPELLAQIYQRPYDQQLANNQQPEDLLPDKAGLLGGRGMDQGGYVDLDGDGNWWIPSGLVFYDPNSQTTPDPDLQTTYEQERAQARQHFFLPRRFQDPFGYSTTVTYDQYDLLVQETRDPLDNLVTVAAVDEQGNAVIALDYRVLQPWLMVDPNGNRASVAFDVLGMVVGTAVMGKPGENKGDLLDDSFVADLDDVTALSHIESPLSDPHGILQKATTRLVYDLLAYRRTKDDEQPQPSVVYTLARETHYYDAPDQSSKIQHSFSYSDGFGREIQKKIRAEPGSVPTRDPVTGRIITVDGQPVMTSDGLNPRWVGSGWTIFNNKGKPVRQYEPFFTDTHCFESEACIGVSKVLFYDPVERVVATLHPNHTYEKVVFDPWRQTTWDLNDTVTLDPRTDEDVKGFTDDYFKTQPADWKTWLLNRIPDPEHPPNDTPSLPPDQAVAVRTLPHAATPAVAYLDTLGRTFLTVADNGKDSNGAPLLYKTRLVLDIEGNQRAVRDAVVQNNDALGRVVMRYDYDMLSKRIHQASMEAGERWTLNNVAGKTIRAWDSRGFERQMTYDALQRPLYLYVIENGPPRLAERTVYGESQGATDNHRTRAYQVFDGAGLVTYDAYDFKGNLLRGKRKLLTDYKTRVNWSDNPSLEEETFVGCTAYDALNRPIQILPPHAGATTDVIQHSYNEANLLNQIDVWLRCEAEPSQMLDAATADLHPVKNIDYNAKGQRVQIDYGNGASTSYEYDCETFRLTHLKTTRPASNNGLTSQLFVDPTVVQDTSYTYDPVGNITNISDSALPVIAYNNEAVEPVSNYTYDAIYRLVSAKGREHIGQTAFDFNPPDGAYRDYPFIGLRAQPNDYKALRNYTETYDYDEVGNIKRLHHAANGGSWNRTHQYNELSLLEPGHINANTATKLSNRLSNTTVGNGTTFPTEHYSHDAHGNMTRMPHFENHLDSDEPNMHWDFKDQLQQIDLGGGGTAYYVYDSAGRRVRKVIESQNGVRQKERIYLGSSFETYREFNSLGHNVTVERESLDVMDDKHRIALVETKTVENCTRIDEPVALTRYQLGNHLGSISLELAGDGALISYEEYHPYGTTAFQAGPSDAEVSVKRYRYIGKEHDEESGFYYHGARYYGAWLGRWVSCDPIEMRDGLNLFVYVRGNPILLSDPSGHSSASGAGLSSGNQLRLDPEMQRMLFKSVKLDYEPQWKLENGLFQRLPPPFPKGDPPLLGKVSSDLKQSINSLTFQYRLGENADLRFSPKELLKITYRNPKGSLPLEIQLGPILSAKVSGHGVLGVQFDVNKSEVSANLICPVKGLVLKVGVATSVKQDPRVGGQLTLGSAKPPPKLPDQKVIEAGVQAATSLASSNPFANIEKTGEEGGRVGEAVKSLTSLVTENPYVPNEPTQSKPESYRVRPSWEAGFYSSSEQIQGIRGPVTNTSFKLSLNVDF